MLFKMTEPEVKPISPPRSELTLLCRDARGSPLRLGLGDEIWQGHILVTGGTGSGKTTVIRQLLARCRDVYPDASFLVLDVKGDYVPYRRPGDKVFSFYGGEDAFRWNILEARASPHPEDELDEMVSVLFSSRVNTAGQNRFFVQAASQVFYGYLLVTLRQCRAGRPAPTHAEMAKWLKKCTLEQMQDRLMLEEDELSGIVSLLKGREAASILSEVHLFAHDFFRGAAEGHDSVAEFITHRGRALYLQYDASRAESGKLSCSIILNRAIAQLLSKDWCRRRVFFILDEAATLPADYGLEKLLALGRDRGARVPEPRSGAGHVCGPTVHGERRQQRTVAVFKRDGLPSQQRTGRGVRPGAAGQDRYDHRDLRPLPVRAAPCGGDAGLPRDRPPAAIAGRGRGLHPPPGLRPRKSLFRKGAVRWKMS